MHKALILKYIVYLAAKHGADPALISAIIEVESNFNPKAIGLIGEQGLMQLRPEFFNADQALDLYDVKTNIEIGIIHLNQIAKHCPHNFDFSVVICHNRGIKGASRVQNPKQDNYYKKVAKAYPRYVNLLYQRTPLGQTIRSGRRPSFTTAENNQN